MATREQFREARQLVGWAPADVALAAATTVAMVSRLENGFGVTTQARTSIKLAFTTHGIAFGRDGSVRLLHRTAAAREGAPVLRLTSQQVRLARQRLGWSQLRLADAAGIGKSTLSSFETGVPVKPKAVAAVMAALAAAGVVVDEPGQVTLRRQP